MGRFRFKNIKSGAGDKSAGVTRVTPAAPVNTPHIFFQGLNTPHIYHSKKNINPT